MNSRNRKSNFINPDLNPCIEESKLSTMCMEKNNYVNELCIDYFNNYNSCKKFWRSVSVARKKAGITPHLPKAEEREYILDERNKGRHVISYSADSENNNHK